MSSPVFAPLLGEMVLHAHGIGDVTDALAVTLDTRANILAMTATAGLFAYATVLNNVAVLTYSAAWTARATLIYGTFAQAF